MAAGAAATAAATAAGAAAAGTSRSSAGGRPAGVPTPRRPRAAARRGPRPGRRARHQKRIHRHVSGDIMPLRMRVHDREPIGMALRRFKKLLERSGVLKEQRNRKYYEKPCEARRRAKLRKRSAIRKASLQPRTGAR